ncbi:ABC transporter permease [Vibrio porteresiae]|uniref:ABC transporter permease n=1 Tax=Vibrio porteresiae DSM 19223 TaxID=1123496 RepID=A0ABZ0Q8L7_9VIBR|nr:ABC transporter permease [Vibrio porteresiae]WPC72792.1 ABC transporter permease [Vibrio porteresiae DSM 19223]
MLSVLMQEWRALTRNAVVVLTVFGGVFFYSYLYPLPYAHQIPLKQPIAVVNLDRSAISYQLERMVDATPQLAVMTRMETIADAKQAFLAQRITGFLVIPEHFYRDLMLGSRPTLSYAGDASYFLVYGTIAEGLAKASGTLSAQAKVTRLLAKGQALVQAQSGYAPTLSNLKPTFNARMGYVDYVVPAVFVLILQQTLVMAAGLIGGTQKTDYRSNRYCWSEPTWKILLTRSIVLVAVYYVLSAYYFGGSFHFHGVNTLANPVQLMTLLLPFLLCSVFIGMVLGAATPKREYVTLLVLVSSMPLVFSAGFIWPVESLPKPLTALVSLFPSTPAIQGFLALNQMGASWPQVATQWTHLWLLTVVWGVLAWVTYQRTQHAIRTLF